MALAQLAVNDLFGRYKHTVPLNRDDHITIIHGPNGIGKTTLLRIIDQFFAGRFGALRQTPFGRLALTFTSGETITIMPVHDEAPGQSQPGVRRLEFSYSGAEGDQYRAPVRSRVDFPLSMIEDVVPELDQVGPREWLDQRTGRLLDLQAVVELYGHLLPLREPEERVPQWLLDLSSSLKVHLIETQRLDPPTVERERYPSRRPPRLRTAVESIGEGLVKHINDALATYAAKSQETDREFPRRVLDALRESPAITDSTLRDSYDRQSKNRERLISAGLLDRGEDIELRADLSEVEQKVLWTYLEDVDKKLEVLYPLADKLDLFRDTLSTKFATTGKRINVRRPEGLEVITDRDETLDVQQLSSGEQHELVLMYRLLFEVKPGSLILIDEPELSLHVSWQQMFLPDLAKISSIASLDFLVATHSPTIIGDRWDLAAQLST